MKGFINYMKETRVRRITFLIILLFSLFIGIPSIISKAYGVAALVLIGMNGGFIFGSWMNYKKYWT